MMVHGVLNTASFQSFGVAEGFLAAVNLIEFAEHDSFAHIRFVHHECCSPLNMGQQQLNVTHCKQLGQSQWALLKQYQSVLLQRFIISGNVEDSSDG